MQILFRYFSIRLGIEKVPMPFSKRLLKISKAPAKQLFPALPLILGRPERDSGRVLFKTAQI